MNLFDFISTIPVQGKTNSFEKCVSISGKTLQALSRAIEFIAHPQIGPTLTVPKTETTSGSPSGGVKSVCGGEVTAADNVDPWSEVFGQELSTLQWAEFEAANRSLRLQDWPLVNSIP
jgi:hypothetical protein